MTFLGFFHELSGNLKKCQLTTFTIGTLARKIILVSLTPWPVSQNKILAKKLV